MTPFPLLPHMQEKLLADPPPLKAAPKTRVAGVYASSSIEPKTNWSLVEQYLPLLKSIVARMRIYFPPSIDPEDIYSIGLTGLISAVKNFNPTKNSSFGSYAKIRIRGSLLDELRRIDTLPREERTKLKKYNKFVEELEQKISREPTDLEICKDQNLTYVQQQHFKSTKNPIYVPLDAPSSFGQTEGPLIHELISDPTQMDSRDCVESSELVELLRDCIEEMDDMSKKILGMYYLEGLRLAEIAEVFKLTESRICQIHSIALKSLRTKLKSKVLC